MWTGKKIKTSSESRRYRVADRLVVKAGKMVRQAGTNSRNRQGSKTVGLEKGECKKQENRKKDKLAQRDRKHRDKYTVENKQHLEG